MCLRDSSGTFISARTLCFTPSTEVYIGEATGLYHAMLWVRQMGLKDVLFELDAKMVVDACNSPIVPNSEFGCIIKGCKDLLYFFSDNSHVEFSRRLTNKIAHTLAGVTLLTASSPDFIDIPSRILTIIMNEMQYIFGVKKSALT